MEIRIGFGSVNRADLTSMSNYEVCKRFQGYRYNEPCGNMLVELTCDKPLLGDRMIVYRPTYYNSCNPVDNDYCDKKSYCCYEGSILRLFQVQAWGTP